MHTDLPGSEATFSLTSFPVPTRSICMCIRYQFQTRFILGIDEVSLTMDNRNQGITEDKGMHQTDSKIAKTTRTGNREKGWRNPYSDFIDLQSRVPE